MDYVLALMFPRNGKPFLRLNERKNGQVIATPGDGPCSCAMIATVGDLNTAHAFKRRVTFLLMAEEFTGLTEKSNLTRLEAELHWLVAGLQGVQITHQVPLESLIRCEIITDKEVN